MGAARFPYPPSTGARALHVSPTVLGTDANLAGYGALVDNPETFPIEIVPWPAQGRRPIDPRSGDQGGIAEGLFELEWRGDTLFGRNEAVGDSYLFGWSRWPSEARQSGPTNARDQVLIWRANYHPDGGQLVYPLGGESFLVSLARAGDEVTPEDFVTFLIEGGRGLYVHPGTWHGPFIPLADGARFLDRQGRVHARVSVDFAAEFGVFLTVQL